MTSTCTAKVSPPCTKPQHSTGLCEGHNRRRLRGLPVDVVLGHKAPRGDAPLIGVNARVERDVVDALRAEGNRTETSMGAAMSAVLRRWARRQS